MEKVRGRSPSKKRKGKGNGIILTNEEKEHFGNTLTRNLSERTALVGLLNIQSLPVSRAVGEEDRIPRRYISHFRLGHLAANVAYNKHDKTLGVKQAGGTASFTCGDCTGCVAP
eukprot:11529469-Ditylum_brightwellii.AAC.1